MLKHRIVFPAVLVLAFVMGLPMARTVSAATDAQLKEQLIELLRENPEIIMDVLDDNRVKLLNIVEQGARDRRDWQKNQQLQKDLADPKDPELNTERPFEGTADAPVVIVEYTDFLCPYCSRASRVMSELIDKYPGKFQLFFKHQPLHDFSRELAVNFEAIAMQDEDLAWQYRDRVFQRQSELGKPELQKKVLNEILDNLGVDRDRLEKDRKDPRIDKWLKADMQEVQKFGLNGTPMFLINGVTVRGAQPLARFEEIVETVQEHQQR